MKNFKDEEYKSELTETNINNNVKKLDEGQGDKYRKDIVDNQKGESKNFNSSEETLIYSEREENNEEVFNYSNESNQDNEDLNENNRSEEKEEMTSSERNNNNVDDDEKSTHSNTIDDVELTDGLILLNQIKVEFKDNIESYDKFLLLLTEFKLGRINAQDVCGTVWELLEVKPHLIKAFNEYLPHHLKKAMENHPLAQRKQQQQAHWTSMDSQNFAPGGRLGSDRMMNSLPLQQHMQRGFEMKDGMQSNIPSFPQPRRQHRAMEFNQYQPPHCPPPVSYYSHPYNQGGRGSPIQPPLSMNQMKPPGLVNSHLSQANQSHLNKFRNCPYNQVKPHYIPKSDMVNRPALKGRQLEFVEEFKNRYSTADPTFQMVIDLMLNTSINRNEVITKAGEILKHDPTTYQMFKKACEPDFPEPEQPPKEKVLQPLEKVAKIMKEKSLEEYFLKFINLFNQKLISPFIFFNIIGDIIDNEEVLKEFKEFLKYKKPASGSESITHKEGSYIEDIEKNRNSARSETHKSILNSKYSCVNTRTSEEEGYTFRDKNHSELILNKLGDERSDLEVTMSRLKYLIVKLYKLSSIHPKDGPGLSIEDFDHSQEILIDNLKLIYGLEHKTMLEKLLTQPNIAIPQVIGRCQMVFKDFSQKQRENKLHWKAVIEQHYYMAYDVEGCKFKENEISSLHLRNIQNESSTPLTVKISNPEIVTFIIEVVVKCMENFPSYFSKRIELKDKIDNFIELGEELINEKEELSFSFEEYSIYIFMLRLYEAINDIFNMEISIEKPSKVVLDLGLVNEPVYNSVKEGVIDLCYKVASKEIDSESFESQLRILTKMKGYRLYNLLKIAFKIDKLVCRISDRMTGNNNYTEGTNLLFSMVKNVESSTVILSSVSKNTDYYYDDNNGIPLSEEVLQ